MVTRDSWPVPPAISIGCPSYRKSNKRRHLSGTTDYCTRFVDAQGGQETFGPYPLNANL